MATVAVLATLDTKPSEAQYVSDILRDNGCRVVLIDASLSGQPGMRADISCSELAASEGTDLPSLLEAGVNKAIEKIGECAGKIIAGLHKEGRIQAALGIGGGRGTYLCSAAFKLLPYGMGKIIVSTAASGETRRFIGTSDIMLVSPVTDLMGLNRINRRILYNSACAAAGMAKGNYTAPERMCPTIAVTGAGVTTPAVAAIRGLLEAQNCEMLAFHARGPGGEAMERIISSGQIDGVIDLSLTEVASELFGGNASAGPCRMRSAGAKGIPQVILPGAIDFINFGPPDTVPDKLREQKMYRHSPAATLVRTSTEQNLILGREIAARLNEAKGPVSVVIPRGGFSSYDSPGNIFYGPVEDSAFCEALAGNIRPGITIYYSDENINHPSIAYRAVELLFQSMSKDGGIKCAIQENK